MKTTSKPTKAGNLFLHLKPLQRVLISLAVAALVWICIYKSQPTTVLTITALWVAFAISLISTSWFIFFKLPVGSIVKKANEEDGSRFFVMVSILISSVASLAMVLLLIKSKDDTGGQETITMIISVSGMMVSWILVHTIFTFHYAYLYYFKGKDDSPEGAALDFPGKGQPDYIDFAYFSFVIGMTFQVSDVNICSPIIRRTVLAHSLISFALNTFVVALTINLIAGVK